MEFVFTAVFTAFCAAVVQGVTGFGFALVVVPLVSLFYDPKVAVAVSLTLGVVTKAPMLIYDRKHVQWRLIAPLAAGALAGILASARLVLSADPLLLRLAIAVTVLVLAILLLFEIRWHIRRTEVATLGVGLVSGLLTGVTSMGGPPVVLFGVNQLWAKESLRANMVAYSSLTFTFTSALFASLGVVTEEVLRLDALMLPGIALGLIAGNWLFQQVSRVVLYRVVVLFIVGTGLVNALSSAAALLAR